MFGWLVSDCRGCWLGWRSGGRNVFPGAPAAFAEGGIAPPPPRKTGKPEGEGYCSSPPKAGKSQRRVAPNRDAAQRRDGLSPRG